MTTGNLAFLWTDTEAAAAMNADAERMAKIDELLIDAATYAETDPPPHDEIVRGLFDTGDKCAMIGSAKKKKTFFALGLSLHIAAGRQAFLHLEIPKRRRVLFVQYEIKSDHFHRRVNRAARAYGITPAELRGWLTIVNGRGIDLAKDFAALTERTGSELVFLDPLYKLMDGDENKTEEWKPLLEKFDRLTVEQGCAVLYVHHDKKGITGDRDEQDRGAGSGVQARDFDAAIYLADHAQDKNLIVFSALARNYAPPEEKTITWQDGRFILSDVEPERRTTHTDRQKARARGRKPCPDAAEVVERFATLPGAITTERADKIIRDMGGTKREAEDIRRELITDGALDAWRPDLKHAPTYIGTAEQIRRKQNEIEAARQKELPRK